MSVVANNLTGVVARDVNVVGVVTQGPMIVNDWAFTIKDIAGGYRLTAQRGSDVQSVDVIFPEQGAQGVGVASASIGENGHLVLKLTDDNELDAGYVIGEQGDQGVSVTETVVDENGHLMVSFSDGNVVDAGKVKGNKGDRGDRGVSVTESAIDRSGHLIITLSDGTTLDAGEAKGPQGTPGTGVTILGSYATVEELKAAHPTGEAGDAYLVEGSLYVWSATKGEWENVGSIQGPAGKDGDNGDPGPAGYTPIRGTDYWTEADKAEIKGYVDSAILGGAW